MPHSVLGPTEDFEASLARLYPPPDPAPSSAEPEPTPRSGTGLDSLASSPQRPTARSSGFSRSSTGHPLTTRELEAARKEHRESETPTQVAERRKLEAQEAALALNAKWQRQHASQARSLSRAAGGPAPAPLPPFPARVTPYFLGTGSSGE